MKSIPEHILYSQDKKELCAYVLGEFDFAPDEICQSDPESLEIGCKKILLLMGIGDDFEKNLPLSKEEKFEDQIDRFLYYFLDFRGLPGTFKQLLAQQVNADLQQIQSYIAAYEKIEFIRKGETPRNHNQRTQHDFYTRCSEEKVKIEAHLATGINERALSKSRRDYLWGMAEMMFEEFRDRPYRLPMPKSSAFFESDKIDKVGHRLGVLPISKGRELKKLYATNKGLFYEELEKEIPDEKVLLYMLQQIDYLPFLPQQRREVFKELAALYRGRMWYGFYALALTQFEGLFGEMCQLCDPLFSSPYAALPDKVSAVRPYHAYSENRFDYFQYHLPNLRNRFLHHGLDANEKIEILCKELLWDLEEVVSIFSELDTDALWLLRLVRKSDMSDFLTVSGLCFYFKTLSKVKINKQYEYFKQEIEHLNENFLPDLIAEVALGLKPRTEALIETISEPIKIQSARNGFAVDLHAISPREINQNSEAVKDALKDTISWQFQSEIEELLDILNFSKAYRRYLDVKYIRDDVQAKIQEVETEHGGILSKIKLIRLAVNDGHAAS